jgi:hypothetical protein
MTTEIQSLLSKMNEPEKVARLFDRVAERCRDPLIFTDEETEQEGTIEGGLVDG